MENNIKAIVAVTEDAGIGMDEKLLVGIKEDMELFVKETKGNGKNAVIMGSKTYDTIGRPLKERITIVITRDTKKQYPGVIVVHSLQEAFAKARDAEITWIIGGEQIYREALPFVEEIKLTRIFEKKPANKFFPDFEDQFEMIDASEKRFDEKNNVYYQFQTWGRK